MWVSLMLLYKVKSNTFYEQSVFETLWPTLASA